jgi:hypothetical protein
MSTAQSARSQRLLTALGLFSVASIGTVVIAPIIARGVSGSDHPSYGVLAGTGVALIALTAIFLSYAGKVIGLGRAWLVFAVVYNAIIVLIKFLVSPIALYRTTFIEGGFFAQPSVKNPSTFYYYAIFVFILYSVALLVLYRLYRKRTLAGIRSADAPVTSRKNRACLALLAAIGLLAVLGIGLVLLFLSGPYVSALMTVAGTALLILLIGAIFSGTRAFSEASRSAIAMKDVGVLVSFFWVAFSLLLIYHVIWVIYTTILISTWPLKTVVPAGGK